MLIDDVILVLAENGEAVLVEATPDAHRELARFPRWTARPGAIPCSCRRICSCATTTKRPAIELPLSSRRVASDRG